MSGLALDKIEVVLADFWVDQVNVQVELGKMAAVAKPIEATMHLDSQIAVDVLCALDPFVGFKLKDDAIRKGGYTSFAQFRAYTIKRLIALQAKHSGAKEPAVA